MNGNPFYAPPVVPDMSGQIMELGRMGMQKDNIAQQRAIEERRLTGQEAHQDRMFNNDTDRLNIQKQELNINERKLPASQQNFGMSDILPFQATLKQRGYDKALQPVIDTIGEWAKDNKVTKGVAASNLVNQWDTFIKPQALDGLQKEYLKRSEDPNFKGSPKEKEMLSMIDTFTQMDGEKAKGVFFPSVAQEEANSKAALQAGRDATNAAKLNPETQFIDNKTIQYMKQGMSQEDATVKAFQDLSKIKSDQARAGRAVTTIGGGGALPANIPMGAPGQKNEAALQGVSAGDAAVIKQLAEYKINLPSGMALRTPYWQNILGRVALYEPTFDATQYNVRMGVKRDFTSGTSSKTALSLNTAIGHLESLAKAAEGLDNGSVQSWNTFRNALTNNLSDDPRVTKFNTTANAVAGELATVFKNTSGTDQEIKSWKDQLNTSMTPAQLKVGAVDQAIELIGSRLVALRNKYEQGLGKPIDFQILSPKSRRILKGLGADVDALDPGGTVSAPTSAGRPPLSSFQK
jgi:hypothetical protein